MASAGIGERLRNARTARGLSLEDVEAATRIRRRYLEALEREAWDELPGAAYAKGFLGSYARQLGLPPDEVAGLFSLAPAPSAAAPAPVEVRITPATPHLRLRRIVTAVVVVLLSGGLFLSYVLYGQLRQFAASRPRPVTATPVQAGAQTPPTAPPSKVAPAGAAPPAGGEPPRTGAGTAVIPTSGASGAGPTPPPQGAVPPIITGQHVAVAVDATDRTWLRVVADGSVVFEGFMSAGDHQAWQGQNQVSLRVGNASALDVAVNGQALGRLGNPGDVVDRTFTAAGAVTAPAAPPAPGPAQVPSVPPAPSSAPPATAPSNPSPATPPTPSSNNNK